MHDYTRHDMEGALRHSGIQEGDTVFFHTSLGLLGIPENVASQAGLNIFFLDCVKSVLGPQGTILVPTYTYSFCRGEPFDIERTPSTIGPFPEFFRGVPGVVRSPEPILSVCGIGPKAHALLDAIPPTSYGVGCLYDKLVQGRAKICTVGLGLNWATFLHHIEELSNVPYRYRKNFCGDMIDRAGSKREVVWTYNVRLWASNADVDASRLVSDILRDGVCKSEPIGRNALYCVRADEYFAYAAQKIQKAPWFVAKGPVGDPLKIEEERVSPRYYKEDFSSIVSLEEATEIIQNLPRDSVSDASDASLNVLATIFPLRLHSFYTGEWHGHALIPEKWTCREATLRTLEGETVFSYQENFLHVATRSHAFEGTISRAELFRHLHADPDTPNTIPLVRYAFRKQWGLCCSYHQQEQLTDDHYHVDIKSDFSYGRMRVGEAIVRGANPQAEVVLCAHLGFAGQLNEGFSGVVAGIETLRALERAGLDRVTCRLVIYPGKEGLYAWMNRATWHVNSTFLGLTMLATPLPVVLTGSSKDSDISGLLTNQLSSLITGSSACKQCDIERDDQIVPTLLRRALNDAAPQLSPNQLGKGGASKSFSLDHIYEAKDLLIRSILACDKRI